jgi:3-phenylpropionate/trans-cinnamate dioxygenase ferredoxin reductase subunit
VAVIGVGVAPNVEFLEGSGVEVQNGVLVDEYCRSSVPDVFAAGDVANWWHPV